MQKIFKTYFKKADIILFVSILALSAAGFALLRHNAGSNAVVDVSISGETVKTVSLYKDSEYRIESEYGYNIICVEDGQVWVLDADCPNKDCEGFGKISKEGEIILCLPHKLAVRIKGTEGGSDAVSY